MKTRKILVAAFSILLTLAFTSCLTCEYKTYTFKFSSKNKGTLTVKYVNIMSEYDDTSDLTRKEQITTDYNEMVNNYIKGDEVVNAFPGAKLVSTRLFEENGQLCGEAVYEFTGVDQVKLFQAGENCPYMFYNSSLFSEEFHSTNGTMGPEYFPVVYWANSAKTLELTTKVSSPEEKHTSLLPTWKKYKY